MRMRMAWVHVHGVTMTSCEPTRRKAYSSDLRWRMVWQREVQRYTLKVADLCVDVATVHRTIKLFESTGCVRRTRSRQRSHNPCMKLSKSVQLAVLHFVLDRPGIYLWEIQQELKFMFNLDVCPATLCRFLKQSNFSRKKMQLVALQRDKHLRSTYAVDVSLYSPHHLVFIDETGCDRRDSLRRYGYTVRGRRIKCQKLLLRGEHISVIAAMGVEGVKCLKMVRGSVTGDIFLGFIQEQLLPTLMTFNGTNPSSVVIMDNCSVHHVSGVTDSIEEVGALVHYLPPYSPDYNPIEMLFSKVKSSLRALELEMNCSDIETILLAAFSTVTTEDCISWITSCDLYN